MRRAIAFCDYQAGWWDKLGDSAGTKTYADAALREGRAAYAREHASLERKMGNAWSMRWRAALIAANATGLVKLITIPSLPAGVTGAPPILELRHDLAEHDDDASDDDSLRDETVSFRIWQSLRI
jgi:hypothetical protein